MIGWCWQHSGVPGLLRELVAESRKRLEEEEEEEEEVEEESVWGGGALKRITRGQRRGGYC